MRRVLTLSAAVALWAGYALAAQDPPPAGSPPPAGPGKPPAATTQPGTPAPGAGQPTKAPGSTQQPSTTAPGAGQQPNTKAPGATQQPSTTAPGQPNTKAPVATQPGATAPGAAQPKTTAPGATLPGSATLPNQAQPGAVSPFPTGSAYPFGTPNLPPFFQNPSVRRELSLSEQQFNQLNENFNRLNTTYMDRFKDGQENALTLELRRGYTANWDKSVGGLLTDRQQLDRYRQLELQYRGLGAFGDPALQERLNLTPEQRTRIEGLTEQVNREWQEINRLAVKDREGAMSRYNAWQRNWQEHLGNIFTGPQRQTWSQMTGNAFSFPPSFSVTTPPATNVPPPSAAPPNPPPTTAPPPNAPPQ